MQHAGHQFGPGAPPPSLHPPPPPPYEPPPPAQQQPSPGGLSITSSLRQWRKKDAQQQQQQQPQPPQPPSLTSSAEQVLPHLPQIGENSSHIARVAPQAHYSTPPTDLYRFPPQYPEYGLSFKDINSPVKYSEIVENASPLLQPDPKEKEYLKMCSIQQQHLKPQYPDPPSAMKPPYPTPPLNPGLHPQMHHYMQKESQIPPYMQKEMPYTPPQCFQKFNMQPPQYANSYAQESNSFLATLSKINPGMAQSIINDPHIREAYPNMVQNHGYGPPQRMYPGPQAGYSPQGVHRNIPSCAQQYGYKPEGGYNRYQSPGYKMGNLEQGGEMARQTYRENVAMNYAAVPQKISPNYPQCAQLEYSQHYQHRRYQMPPEYYHTQPYKNPYQELPPPSEPAVPSARMKQFWESWGEDEVEAVAEAAPEKKDDRPPEQLYVLGATEIPRDSLGQYVQLEALPELCENGSILIKATSGEEHKRIAAAGPLEDQVVNLHIVEAAQQKAQWVVEAVVAPEEKQSPKSVPEICELLEETVVPEQVAVAEDLGEQPREEEDDGEGDSEEEEGEEHIPTEAATVTKDSITGAPKTDEVDDKANDIPDGEAARKVEECSVIVSRRKTIEEIVQKITFKKNCEEKELNPEAVKSQSDVDDGGDHLELKSSATEETLESVEDVQEGEGVRNVEVECEVVPPIDEIKEGFDGIKKEELAGTDESEASDQKANLEAESLSEEPSSSPQPELGMGNRESNISNQTPKGEEEKEEEALSDGVVPSKNDCASDLNGNIPSVEETDHISLTDVETEDSSLKIDAFKLENNNVLLHLDGALVEIKVSYEGEKKVITVVPYSGDSDSDASEEMKGEDLNEEVPLEENPQTESASFVEVERPVENVADDEEAKDLQDSPFEEPVECPLDASSTENAPDVSLTEQLEKIFEEEPVQKVPSTPNPPEEQNEGPEANSIERPAEEARSDFIETPTVPEPENLQEKFEDEPDFENPVFETDLSGEVIIGGSPSSVDRIEIEEAIADSTAETAENQKPSLLTKASRKHFSDDDASIKTRADEKKRADGRNRRATIAEDSPRIINKVDDGPAPKKVKFNNGKPRLRLINSLDTRGSMREQVEGATFGILKKRKVKVERKSSKAGVDKEKGGKSDIKKDSVVDLSKTRESVTKDKIGEELKTQQKDEPVPFLKEVHECEVTTTTRTVEDRVELPSSDKPDFNLKTDESEVTSSTKVIATCKPFVSRSVSEDSSDCSSKKRLTLAEYTNRKKRLSSASPAIEVPSESQEALNPFTKALISAPSEKVIDINAFDIPTRSQELEEIRKLPSYTMDNQESIKSFAPDFKFQLPSRLEVLKQKQKEQNDLLMRRFLNYEKLSRDEMQKVKEIIHCKRMLVEMNRLRMQKLAAEHGSGVYERVDASSNMKLHLKKVADPKPRKRFRNLHAGSPDSEGAEPGESDYLAYQTKVTNGVPKIIIRRRMPGLMQPYVRLERSPTIDRMAKRKGVC